MSHSQEPLGQSYKNESKQYPAPPRTFRILSMDGGPSGLRYLYSLLEVTRAEPSFLLDVDLFAGNSASSFLALYLASRTDDELADGPRAIEKAIQIQHQFLAALMPQGLRNKVKQGFNFLTGRKPLLRSDNFVSFLRQPEVFGDRKFEDLQRFALIVTFRLFNLPEDSDNPRPRRWGPHIYHNLLPDPSDPAYSSLHDLGYFGSPSPEFRTLPIAEISARSGAMPLFFPVHSGFVDGAIFANNPEVVSIAQTLKAREWLNIRYNRDEEGNFSPKGWIRGTEDLLLLSMGGGDAAFGGLRNDKALLESYRAVGPTQTVEDHSENNPHLLSWGWRKWLFDIKSPFLLLSLILNADAHGNNHQASNFLLPATSFRLNAISDQGIIRDLLHASLGLGKKNLLKEAEEDSIAWRKASPTLVEFFAHVYTDFGRVPTFPPGEPFSSDELDALPPHLLVVDRVVYEALRTLHVPPEQAIKLTLEYKESRATVSNVAQRIMDVNRYPGVPVLERIQDTFAHTEADTGEMLSFLMALIKNMFELAQPHQSNTTYLEVLIWVCFVWQTPDDQREMQRDLLTLISDPFYAMPLLEFLQEKEASVPHF
ncbi:MAG: hypothetical protein EP343_14755 [Deltaproteobacteria bacterium]|nr:MAG: hypothetical protein EP343_14755 [Deltaproteobacteria bacterium]